MIDSAPHPDPGPVDATRGVLVFRGRGFEFRFPRPALVMGIVNVTPDSFSDGGRFLDPEAAVAHALELAAQGAAMIDVGGESTRPGAHPVSPEEECRRVIPVIERLATRIRVPISVDTHKPEVARAALGAGAAVVNDIAAGGTDGAMWSVVSEAGAGYVCMHMKGDPQTMQQQATYRDVVGEVFEFFVKRLAGISAAGIAPEQVLIDVGIGFGKTAEHNLQLIAGLGHFKKLERPLLVGVSRKSFIGKLLGAETGARLPGSLAGAIGAVQAGAHIIRAHDVAETVQALRMWEAIQSRKQ